MQIPTLHGLPEAARREWRALEAETDPQLFLESAYHFARRQETAGRLEAAAELYAAVAQEADAVGAVPPLTGDKRERPLRIRAQEGLDAILGRGAFGPRAEFLLRNLAQQSSDPSMIFAMGAAGAVFRMTRLATLSRLAATPSPGFLTQFLGAGRLASMAGFALEAPAFTLAARLGNEALGRSQDWSGRALGRDLASSYLVLGGLKLAGHVGANLVFAPGRGGGGRTQGSPLQLLLQQGSMLTGILLGHALEERLGLRPHHDGATTLVDSLALLLQFNVAGRLTRQSFGPRVAAWERGLDLQAEAMIRRPRPIRPEFRAGPSLEYAWAQIGRPARGAADPREGPNGPRILMMIQGNGGEGNGNGNGNGKGSAPGRTRTILGLGRSSPPPAPATPPPPRLEAPLYAESAFAAIEGLSPQARRLSLVQLKISTLDPEVRLVEGLDQYFRDYRDPVVITLGTNFLLEPSAQGMFKVELHRLYREYSVPAATTVTLLIPSENAALHFRRQWLGFRVERVALPAAEPFEGTKREFRAFLENIDSSANSSPVICLDVGCVDEGCLQDLGDILSEHPLPEDRKITIFWMEEGGGNVVIQRQGELVRAEWRGFHAPQRVFWLAPTESRFGHLQVFPAEALIAYVFVPPDNYEVGVEQQLRRLHGWLGYPRKFEAMDARSDGAARHGEILAKLGLHWLRENGRNGNTLSHQAQINFIKIHRILERAHALLDLGLPRRFAERLGPEKLRRYREVAEGINRTAVSSGQSLLLPLEEFAADLPGDYVLPISDVLRWAFADQLFKDRGGSRIPLENNGLRRDPRRLGHIFRETLRSRALPLLASIKIVERSGAGESLQTLMTPGRTGLSEYHDKMRRDVDFFLEDWGEVARVLNAPRGGFHRAFLTEVFHGPRGIRSLYGQVLENLQALPPELRRRQRLDELPSLPAIDAILRGSRP
ncbi:MAG: hypothetical protein IT572_07770 [Deltaproteobacteria bacterium]|nr:hypothetical protein [Deltaproteobacteria bacterium]